MRDIIRQGNRISDTGPRKCQAFLIFEIGHFFNEAVAQLMFAAFIKFGGEQALHITRFNRAIANAAFWRFNLDKGFKPRHAARGVANDLYTDLLCGGFSGNCRSHFISANRLGRGITRHVNPDHVRSPSTMDLTLLRLTRATGLSSIIMVGDEAHRPKQ